MTIVCDVEPKSIITQNIITGIDFIFHNSTMSHSAPREVTLNGQDLGYICFVCGHPTIPIDNDTRCYSYYGKNDNQIKILLFV